MITVTDKSNILLIMLKRRHVKRKYVLINKFIINELSSDTSEAVGKGNWSV